MWKQVVVGAFIGVASTVVAVHSSSALEKVSDGVFRVTSDQVGDLLTLQERPDVKVLMLDQKDPRDVFDAHIRLTRDWVEAGGVLWVAGDALKSAIARGIAPFRVERFKYSRTSGKSGGELVVKGASQRLVIHEHQLTNAVDQLYLVATEKFDGTAGTQPLVEMTDTKGHHGLVLLAIPVGQGLLVLDGTSRKGQLSRQPNSLKQDGVWSSYDWNKMATNATSYVKLPS